MATPGSAAPEILSGSADAGRGADVAVGDAPLREARSAGVGAWRRARLAARTIVAGAAALAALAVAGAATAGEGSPGSGTFLASGSKVRADIRSADDCDDFVFEGYAGQTVLAVAKSASGSSLSPEFVLFRPDRSVAAFRDRFTGASPPQEPSLRPAKSRKLEYPLDETGVWTLRVRGAYPGVEVEGDDPATEEVEARYVVSDFASGRTAGAYALAFRTVGSLSGGYAGPALAPGTQRLSVPLGPGAAFSYRLRWRDGAAPTFAGLTDPSGRAHPGTGTVYRTSGRSAELTQPALPGDVPLGLWTLALVVDDDDPPLKFRADYRFEPPKRKPLRATFSQEEPIVLSVQPPEGGPRTIVTVNGAFWDDPGAPKGTPRVLIGGRPIDEPERVAPGRIRGRAPAGLPASGLFDVVVESTSGQAGVLADAFRTVPPPVLASADPTVGCTAGGFVVTLTGSGFRTTPNGVEILYDGAPAGVIPLSVTPTQIRFTAPPYQAGPANISVRDAVTSLESAASAVFDVTSVAQIGAVSPPFVPVLGGDAVTVRGACFAPSDVVWLETAQGSDVFEAQTTTFVSENALTITAPARAKGTCRLYVEGSHPRTQERPLTWYSFADFSPRLGLPGGAEEFDGVTSAAGDVDGDGDLDLVLSREGGAGVSAAHLTRVLRNDGTGRLEDVSADMLPPIGSGASADDLRAGRVRLADQDGDGFLDLWLLTDDRSALAPGLTRMRILRNEPGDGGRVFRNVTADTMAPPRTMVRAAGAGTDAWNWAGRDVWVGDLDGESGPPEIVLVDDETQSNRAVLCAPYCATPYATGYAYDFEWGGSAAFVWDPRANSGRGRYRFDANFFPGRAGVNVPFLGAPPGVDIGNCAEGSCSGTFTPFLGTRVAVGDIDGDGRNDVAVLGPDPVDFGGPRPPLQIGLRRDGLPFGLADFSSAVASVGGDLAGDALAIGRPGAQHGDPGGLVVFASRRADLPGARMRALRFLPPAVPSATGGGFEDVGPAALPSITAEDRLAADDLAFADFDGDGDEDLVSVQSAVPPGGASALRLWRNETPAGGPHVFRATVQPLLTTGAAPPVTTARNYEGVCLAIGDLDGDGAAEIVVTRDGTSGTAPHTRAITRDR